MNRTRHLWLRRTVLLADDHIYYLGDPLLSTADEVHAANRELVSVWKMDSAYAG